MVGTVNAEQNTPNCENIIFSINGPEKTLINQEYTFTVNGYELSYQSDQSSTGQQNETETVLATGTYKVLLGDEATIQYDVIANNKAINRFYEDQLIYNFKQSGKYQIQATIRHPQCTYKITKDINTFSTLYTRVGNEPTSTAKSLVTNIEQKDIGFGIITISKQENLSQGIKDNQQIIKDSEAIIIDYNNYNDIFKAMQSIIQEKETQKDIIIVSSTAKQITKKILAPVLKESHLTKIYLLSEAELANVMVELSIEQTPTYKQFLISYEWIWFITSLSSIIDNLIYQGFPIELMSMLLALTLAIALIVFRKQVLWFNAFGLYYPLLFALYLHLLGPKTAIALLLIAMLAQLIIGFINKKITLLVSAKLWATLILYFVASIVALRISKKLFNRPESFVTFSQDLFIIAYITTPLIANKIGNKIHKIKTTTKSMIQFFILSRLVYSIFHNTNIQHTMLIQPLYILLTIIVVISIGRYTWLQLTEVFRFSQLIKYTLSKKRH